MVQWMARFENSKVDACRAYWGAAGNLDELVVENNKVNGANAEMIETIHIIQMLWTEPQI